MKPKKLWLARVADLKKDFEIMPKKYAIDLLIDLVKMQSSFYCEKICKDHDNCSLDSCPVLSEEKKNKKLNKSKKIISEAKKK